MVEFEDQTDRWVDLHWAPGHHAATNGVTLEMAISNDPGVLGRICTLVAEQNANISDLRFVDRKPDFFRVLMEVEVRDAEHLHAVIMAVGSDSDMAEIRRHREVVAPEVAPRPVPAE
jgi:GTP pyrophosphokinase/guanosine-3',5'-bis(diphosphate) 3'-pyrophosphohydrolase